MATISLAALLLSGLTLETPVPYVVLVLFVLGIGYGLFSSPNTNAVMGSVRQEDFGVAAGTLATMRFVGQSISLTILTWVLLMFVSSGSLTIENGTLGVPINQFVTGLSAAFVASAIISAIGVGLSLARGTHGAS